MPTLLGTTRTFLYAIDHVTSKYLHALLQPAPLGLFARVQRMPPPTNVGGRGHSSSGVTICTFFVVLRATFLGPDGDAQ